MPAYVVYRPSVARGGRLLVRAAAVLALLVAAVVAIVLVTHAEGQKPRSGSGTAKARTASSHAAAPKASSATGAKSHGTTSTAKKAQIAKTTVKPAHTPKPKAHVAIPAPRATPVAVLNGGTAQGAAAALAGRLRSLGYPVPVVGNAGRRDLPMAIEYSAGLGPAARALAKHVGAVQYVTPLEGPNRNLSGARLLVIVGN
jgi:hypothetical protein